jgi:nucleoid-associated protein YgaU
MAAVIVTTAHPRRSVERVTPRPPLQVIPGGRKAARAHARAQRFERPLTQVVYRRRRVGAALVLVSLVLVAYLAVAGLRATMSAASAPSAVSGSAAAAGAGSRVYVVQPGDTLWTIARSLHPHGDIRPVVDALERRAGGADLVPGQRVRVDGLVG